MIVAEEVLAASYPVAYLAGRVAGGLVPVVCPVPPAAVLETWVPDREALVRFQRARVILVNGAGLERWVTAASLPRSRLSETTRDARDRLIELTESVVHAHGPGGAHEHRGISGYTWLDPALAAVQAEAVAAAMTRAFPQHAAAFEGNLAVLRAELADLDRLIAELADRARGKELFADAPSYPYLGARLGLTIRVADPASLGSGVLLVDAASLPTVGPGVRVVAFPVWSAPPPEGVDLLGSLRDSLGALSSAIE
jgi:zinc transport system substrate-binding protein